MNMVQIAHPTPNQDWSAPKLSIVILCRNEEISIARCVTEAHGFLERNTICGEVLVVDNNSQDQSAARAEEAGARVVLEQIQGYGNTIIAGIEAARGQFIILGDGDGEHDLGALEPFWEHLQEGYDFVFGNRFVRGGGGDSEMPFLRRHIGNPLLSGIGKLLFQSPVGDFHCGLRGFSAASVRALALQCPGMELASEMIAKAIRMNMRITEVPVVQRRAMDPNRSSHLRIWQDGWRHLRLLLVLSHHWLFLYPGCLLVAAGALLLTMPVLYTVEEGGLLGAYTMIFGAAFAISGNQMIFFALLASAFYKTMGLAHGFGKMLGQRRGLPEAVFAFGLALALLGAVGGVWSLFVWAQTTQTSDVAAAIEARLQIAIPAVTLLALGLQMMFSMCFLALLTIPRSPKRETVWTMGD